MVTGYEGYEVPGEKYYPLSTNLVTGTGVVDIFTSGDRYAALVTNGGVDIVDLQCGQVIASGTLPGTEMTCVAIEDTTVFGNLYIGTTTSGVYSKPWVPLPLPDTDFSSSFVQEFTTITSPPISSNAINDIDVAAAPYRLLISTAVGVDFILEADSVFRSTRTLTSGSSSCQLTSDGEGYWTVINSGVEASYDLNSSSGTGIIVVDFEYNASASDPLLPSNQVNDISVVAGTPNLLNFATTAGDFVVEESQGSEATSLTKSLFITDNVISADFSQSATFNSVGTKYVSTTGVVTIFDLSDDSTIGTHYQEIPADDKFVKENTRDQALLSGTNTVIRTTSVA